MAAWLPAGLWMLIIFLGSTDLLASSRTGRFLEPFLRWLVPTITPETLRAMHAFVRKSGHVLEYAILALLIWRGLTRRLGLGWRAWSGPRAVQALALATLYAATDELHQALQPARMGRLLDVGIDAAGAGLGLVVLWWWLKRGASASRSGLGRGSIEVTPGWVRGSPARASGAAEGGRGDTGLGE